MGALALGKLQNRLDRVAGPGIEGDVRAHVRCQLAALRREIQGDDAGAHGVRQLAGRQANRPLAKDGDGFVAAQ